MDNEITVEEVKEKIKELKLEIIEKEKKIEELLEIIQGAPEEGEPEEDNE